jgi:arsenite methyltransferase
MSSSRPAGAYGTDAAWVPWLWVGFSALYVLFIVLSATVWNTVIWVTLGLALVALFFLVGAALYCHASWRGKFEVWSALLDEVTPPGRILDMGCGRGAVSIMAARRFDNATVDGVDLWRTIDQSGNSIDQAEANARTNGVQQRVRFTTADMTDLPFPEAGFDLITASLSIHNIHSREGRRRAIDEAWRCVKPGGRLLIFDISKTSEYRERLVELGSTDLSARNAGWRVWWTGPWMASYVVSATKPAGIDHDPSAG